jgi:hypothetical protein
LLLIVLLLLLLPAGTAAVAQGLQDTYQLPQLLAAHCRRMVLSVLLSLQ